MIPESLAQKLMNIKSLPYAQMLKKHGFILFKNAFSDGASTKSALNMFLAMDREYYRAMPEKQQHEIIIGKVAGPLLEIFKANGYSTNIYHREFTVVIVSAKASNKTVDAVAIFSQRTPSDSD
jgi:hypothetical protein